jgi:hypothetical protein
MEHITYPASVVKKMHAVMKGVKHLAKEGRNSAQNYNYLAETQITELFKGLLEENGLIFTYQSSITDVRPSPSGKQLVTDVRVRYSFVDVETGEAVSGTVAGQGSDSGDKGVYKAITGAIKYIFMKTFLIPTGDDPEDDSKDKKSAKKTKEEEFIDSLPEED